MLYCELFASDFLVFIGNLKIIVEDRSRIDASVFTNTDFNLIDFNCLWWLQKCVSTINPRLSISRPPMYNFNWTQKDAVWYIVVSCHIKWIQLHTVMWWKDCINDLLLKSIASTCMLTVQTRPFRCEYVIEHVTMELSIYCTLGSSHCVGVHHITDFDWQCNFNLLSQFWRSLT